MAYASSIRVDRIAEAPADVVVYEIATLPGYSSESSFGRAFRRWVGVGPAQYRRGETDPTDSPWRHARRAARAGIQWAYFKLRSALFMARCEAVYQNENATMAE